MSLLMGVAKKLFFVCVGIAMGIGCAYFFSKDTPRFQCKFVIGEANIPHTWVNIQGNEYPMKIDFGSKFALTLPSRALDPLKKKPHGTTVVRDLKGGKYEVPLFLLAKVQIGNHVFKEVVVEEISEASVINNAYPINQNRDALLKNLRGVIGRPLLEQMNLVLDCKRGILQECCDVTEFEQMGYSREEFVEVPFTLGRTGFILDVQTEVGPLRLSFDTGITLSLMRNSLLGEQKIIGERDGVPYWVSSQFKIGGYDFGAQSLFVFGVTDELHEIDGILGMDFLEKHVIYINNQDKLIYIQK